MNLWSLLLLLSFIGTALAQKTPMTRSVRAQHDVALDTDPASPFWRGAPVTYAEVDENGNREPELRTEVRSRWTKGNIYFLFVCPYTKLYLKPAAPDIQHETYELWNWNVAEVFIGTDFKDIERYKEFEVSPQNEWIDLDVNLHHPHHEEGWVWNSGFEHATRVDGSRHVWYAALRIPFSALMTPAPSTGTTFRVNFYRTEGGPNDEKEVMWQAVMGKTFHAPEHFGLLKLAIK